MRRALRLAERGRGQTSPNPMVGAIIVLPDGTIAGDGYHEQAGTPHAEVHALNEAGDRARGARLICTLEPCCHHGRTGPCVERIVASGIKEVIAAVEDPNPRVAGAGFRYLESHGVAVTVGVEVERARQLNAPFFTLVQQARPFVIAKAAVSIDGYVAAATGQRTAISSPASLRKAQQLRAEVDAIAVGVGTMLADDPQLTVRDVYRTRPFVRVIFDRHLRTPATARVFRTLENGPVHLFCDAASAAARPGQVAALERAGACIERTNGTVEAALRCLAGLGVLTVLLEGGPRLHQAAGEAGMIDEVHLFIAPTALGPGGVPMSAHASLSIPSLQSVRLAMVGPDLQVTGYVHRPH
jgi:diaminohydroxyphosphoribosylaminopyrimidine deaminase / 5-amino-6-(5-phosphoribosylamino)uracil reductase